MARITKKTIRRCRIQFTVDPNLHERYTAYLTQAKALCIQIDFSHDFEEWLKNQLEQIGQELSKIETEQTNSHTTHSSDNSPSTIRRNS